jgi:pyruvate dehydrogenase E2 component (dihydrolipoamide acetyltransferase)/2-oxoglutarate dehydrogenase E2 component (dihydrolipoamide succinyltransferase)
MPLDVIMPALGMAQDSGVIVSWLKQPGDAVAEGDALFEVETDKATMEVEAQGKGYLTDVTAAAGEAVPVGQVIAQISDSAEGSGKTPAPKTEAAPAPTPAPAPAPASEASGRAMPEGHRIIMPALGMAQDSGLLVSWQKAPGDKVGADETLFEVETDKAAMEVPAGFDGYIAALLAEAGEDIPVGGVVAIISKDKPEAPFAQSAASATSPAPATKAPAPEKADTAKDTPTPAKPQPTTPMAAPRGDGRILASPKARRLALERGLDLQRLVDAGHAQPFHVRDLEALAHLPSASAGTAPTPGSAARRLSAEVAADGFDDLCLWASDRLGISDANTLLAGFAAACLRRDDSALTVDIVSFGRAQAYANPDRPWLGQATAQASEGVPALRIRDLRHSALCSVEMGPEDCPTLTLTQRGTTVSVTLECGADQLSAEAALTLLTGFAGRMEQPLRHLL